MCSSIHHSTWIYSTHFHPPSHQHHHCCPAHIFTAYQLKAEYHFCSGKQVQGAGREASHGGQDWCEGWKSVQGGRCGLPPFKPSPSPSSTPILFLPPPLPTLTLLLHTFRRLPATYGVSLHFYLKHTSLYCSP